MLSTMYTSKNLMMLYSKPENDLYRLKHVVLKIIRCYNYYNYT
jgi:hypothetical protein